VTKAIRNIRGDDGYREFEKKGFHDCLPIMSWCFNELITGSVPGAAMFSIWLLLWIITFHSC